MALVGTEVAMAVSDPWDFVTEHGGGPFRGRIVAADEGRADGGVLVELERPLASKGKTYRFVVLQPRYEGASLAKIEAGDTVVVAATYVPDDRARSDNPMDLSWWRGGLASIGGVTKV